MKRCFLTSLLIICVGLILCTVSGCDKSTAIQNPDLLVSRDYLIQADTTVITAQLQGGGLFIISRGNRAADESIELELIANLSLNATLSNTKLTNSNWFSELSVIPDSRTDTNSFIISIVYKYENKKDTLELLVNIDSNPQPGTIEIPMVVLAWLRSTYPALPIEDNTKWHCYNPRPDIDGVGNFVFLSDELEITKFNRVHSDYNDQWYAVRKRNQNINPTIAVIYNPDGYITEAPIADYFEEWGVKIR